MLIASIGEPGVARRCAGQYDAAPMEQHHPVSQLVCGRMRALLDVVGPDGSNVHADLEVVVETMRHIPMDDSVGEGPRARAKHIYDSARGSGWAWMASTTRL